MYIIVSECVDLTGTHRRPILELDKFSRPYGITLTQNHVFWTDWAKCELFFIKTALDDVFFSDLMSMEL